MGSIIVNSSFTSNDLNCKKNEITASASNRVTQFITVKKSRKTQHLDTKFDNIC